MRTAFERLGWTPQGLRAVERASIDALRPNYNSVNTEDLYGISIIREKFPAPTGRRRFPQKGRRSPVPAKGACEGTGKENVLAESHGIFHQRKSADRACRASKRNGSHPERAPQSRKPESVEVTTPRLYVGNLSFEATESDLFELFNGVGQVQNAEVVTYKHNQRSKGFAFVQMNTVEEAQRAVTELHDKEFLGRKLLVSGAKSSEHHSAS